MEAPLLMWLASCSPTPVIADNCPASFFPACSTTCDAIRPGAPASVAQDWLHVDNLSLKLMGINNEHSSFGDCRCPDTQPAVR